MKILSAVVLLVFSITSQMLGQSALAYRATERGKNFTVMEAVSQGKTNRYTIVGNGINWTNALGQWVESRPVIQNYAGGIVCTGNSYRVILSQNLNQIGSVDLQAADGERIISHPLGLYFYDPESGKSVLLGQIQDCYAEVAGTNEVIYRNAFAAVNGSGISAAVTYHYGEGRFAQDVTLTTKPAVTPAQLGMSTNTRVEIASEIVSSSTVSSTPHLWRTETNAVLRAFMADPDVLDETLTFGPELTMTLGQAFATRAAGARAEPGVPVAKRLVEVQGRTLLLESVGWNEVRSRLDKLTAGTGGGTTTDLQARLTRELPKVAVSLNGDTKPASAKVSFETRLQAVSRSSRKKDALVAVNRTDKGTPVGFVMDYPIVVGGYANNYTFYQGSTYWVQSDFWVSVATFQAGAVIKYSPGTSLYLSSSVTFPNSGDPIVFTAVDDNTVGEALGNGNPQGSDYAYWAMYCYYVYSPITASQLDVRFAQQGIYCYLVDSTFTYCSLANCSLGFYADQCTMTLGYAVDMCNVQNWYDYSGNYGGDGWVVDNGVSAGCGPDSDFDGLDDAWETQYFGNLNQSAQGDYDGDGLLNGWEYQHGLDPTQATGLNGADGDPDGDGLSNLQEQQNGTNPTNPDTDSDGLSDGLEVQLGLNPSNAYSQDSTHTYKDGQWYLTAQTGQSGTRMQIALDTAGSFFDAPSGLTYLYFNVSGTAPSDVYDIYIQTPSVNPGDNSFVWQDMFYDFGYQDLGADQNGGHVWETAWYGDVPLDGSVKFAALDSEDRDYDGLRDGYEILGTQTTVGAPDSDKNSIADGDDDPDNDGIPNSQERLHGTNPLVADSDADSDGNSLPDWMDNYIAIWGNGANGPWGDADGDHLPNMVEYEIGTDPTIPDFWGDLPPPTPNGLSDESQQFVSLQRTASYGASEGPNKDYFPYFGFSSGPLGESAAMVVQTSGTGAGTATLDFEVMPLDQIATLYDTYGHWAPFSQDASPDQGELPEPDPADGELYKHILLEASHMAEHLWHEIDESVVELLHSDTLLYVHATSMLEVHYQCRQLQYLHYVQTTVGDQLGITMRIERCENVIEADMTRITAVDTAIVHNYPNLDWVHYSLGAAGFLATAVSWYENYPILVNDYVLPYVADIRNHRNHAAADLLSCKIQELAADLDPLFPQCGDWGPIYSPYPLGWYDGY